MSKNILTPPLVFFSELPLMIDSIDLNLRSWLLHFSKEWKTTVEQVALLIDKDYQEIPNRERYYPKIAKLLCQSKWEMQELVEIGRKCYVLADSYDAIRFSHFAKTGEKAEQAIHKLVDDFPNLEKPACDRINQFIDTAITLGYSTPRKTADRAGAACLASLLLTSLQSERFVDFRQKRWTKFAELLGYPILDPKTSYQ